MTDPFDICVGWLVSETAPGDSDYEPRGGYVVAIEEKGTEPADISFTTLKNVRGKLVQTDLRGDQIDVGLVLPPRLQQPGPLVALIETILRTAASQNGTGKKLRFTEYQRWLLGAAYRLSEHA